MKTIEISGHKVQTNLDEQDVFRRCLGIEGIEPVNEAGIAEQLQQELDFPVGEMLNEMLGEKKMSLSDFIYEHSRGYKDRRLEPFKWKESIDALRIDYTGTQGGEPWYAIINKAKSNENH